MKSNTILLTGATGAFGKYILNQLLETNNTIVALVRAKNGKTAEERLAQYAGAKQSGRLRAINGDLSKKNLGLSNQDYVKLQQSTTAIIHAAASTRFNLPLVEAHECNVTTTHNVLHFAYGAKNLAKFGYISTAFVAGKKTGLIPETEFGSNNGFVNSYDETKFEAETQVRAAMQKIPVTIYRPSLIIASDSNSHHAAVAILNLLKSNLLPILPGQPTDLIDLISAGEASQAIIKLFIDHFISGETYHIASGQHAPKLSSIVALAKSPNTPLTYTGHSINMYDKAVSELLNEQPGLQPIYQKIDCFIKYLCYPKLFDTQHTEAALDASIGKDNVINVLKECISE
jgi:nucleoside-diphosphate-sugar epimerase